MIETVEMQFEDHCLETFKGSCVMMDEMPPYLSLSFYNSLMPSTFYFSSITPNDYLTKPAKF
jgi:hypothetical protein